MCVWSRWMRCIGHRGAADTLTSLHIHFTRSFKRMRGGGIGGRPQPTTPSLPAPLRLPLLVLFTLMRVRASVSSTVDGDFPTPRRLLISTMGDAPSDNANLNAGPTSTCADFTALLNTSALSLGIHTRVVTRFAATYSDLGPAAGDPSGPAAAGGTEVDVLVVNGPWDAGARILVHEFRRHAAASGGGVPLHAREHPLSVVLRCVEGPGVWGGEPGVDGYLVAGAQPSSQPAGSCNLVGESLREIEPAPFPSLAWRARVYPRGDAHVGTSQSVVVTA
jgi:hypothetical protein